MKVKEGNMQMAVKQAPDPVPLRGGDSELIESERQRPAQGILGNILMSRSGLRRLLLFLPLLVSFVLIAAACGSDDEPIGVLFVQDAAFASFSDDGGGGQLVLEGIDPGILYFTDRPGRQVGTVALETALEGLFASDSVEGPPNAALSWSEGGTERTAVVVLESADYDADAATITYRVRPLDGDTQDSFDIEDSDLPSGPVGPVSLFIDADIVNPQITD